MFVLVNLGKCTSIVVHPGQAHDDEFLAVIILLAILYHWDAREIPVFRREPTAADLLDPSVVVIDVGGRHEPELNNYDHHQWRGTVDAPCCALTLILKEAGVYDMALDMWPWLRTTELLDSCGPIKTAEALKLPPHVFDVGRPPNYLLRVFGNQGPILPHDFCGRMLRDAGLFLTQDMQAWTARMKIFEHNMLGEAKGLTVVWATAVKGHEKPGPIFGLEAWVKKHAPGCAITVTHDDRGGGCSLYRREDHPRVDFTRVKDDPRVAFSHQNGFIAKTQPGLTMPELMEVIEAAISPAPPPVEVTECVEV